MHFTQTELYTVIKYISNVRGFLNALIFVDVFTLQILFLLFCFENTAVSWTYTLQTTGFPVDIEIDSCKPHYLFWIDRIFIAIPCTEAGYTKPYKAFHLDCV